MRSGSGYDAGKCKCRIIKHVSPESVPMLYNVLYLRRYYLSICAKLINIHQEFYTITYIGLSESDLTLACMTKDLWLAGVMKKA